MLDMSKPTICRFFKCKEIYVAEDSPKKPKRRLKAPAETVRERAEKAQEVATKPKRKRRAAKFFSKAGNSFRPLAVLGKPFKTKPFRWLGRKLFPHYLVDSWRELRLVAWPTRRQTYRLTGAVMIFSIIFGVLVALVDFGLDKVFKQVFIK